MFRFFKGFAAAALVTFIVMLIVVVRSCGKEDNPPAPEIPPPPVAIPVQIDGYTAFVPPGPQRLPDVSEHLVDAVREGTQLVTGLRLDKSKCVSQKKIQLGWKRCIGDYLVAAVNAQGEMRVVEVYGGKSTAPAGFGIRYKKGGILGAVFRGLHRVFFCLERWWRQGE